MSSLPLPLLGLLLGLLAVSAFFSSAETAFFSLTPRECARLPASGRRLIDRPSQLLVSILLCNLVINVLYFAFASRLVPEEGGWKRYLLGIGVLVFLIVFGEILPKTIGLRAGPRVARFATPTLRLAVVLLGPLTRPLRRFLEHLNRLVSLVVPEEPGITSELLARVMERGGKEGALLGEEADLLAEIIELGDIRVREIMTPRVDTLFLDVTGRDRDEVAREALAKRMSWLPVVDGSPDRVVGRVRVRDLFHRGGRPVRQLVMPVKFVPEVASALDLLHRLHEDRTSEAVVVDEWGGTAGYVTAEDVFEELVGDLRTEGEESVPAVVPLGEGRYRVAGGLAIREWNEAFGLQVVPREFETVGGFVTAILGRIPRAGDTVTLEDLSLEVHDVRGRRVRSVDIGVRGPLGATPRASITPEEPGRKGERA